MVLELFKSIRIPECLMVITLGFISFKYTSVSSDNLVLATLFFIVAATMLQNNWRDRFHDVRKGKTFAFKNPGLFISWLVSFWIICAALIVWQFRYSPATASLLLAMALVGILYSEARRMPFLSIVLVTLTVSSSLLLPITLGGNFSNIAWIFIAVILIMLGRENLHDIADVNADEGYKKTIPILMGDKFAHMVSVITLIVGCIITMLITPISIFGSAFILLGLSKINKDKSLKLVRRQIDVGLLLLTLGLLV